MSIADVSDCRNCVLGGHFTLIGALKRTMDSRYTHIGGRFRPLLLFFRSTLIILKVDITRHGVSPYQG